MTITPLDLGAWISVYSGFTLLRSSMTPGPRESRRLGSGRRRAAAGYALIALGALVLAGVCLRHLLRGI